MWGAALVLNLVWPLQYRPAIPFLRREAEWTFLWDLLKDSDAMDALLAVLPVPFGIAAIYAARQLPAAKQSFIYLIGGFVCLLGPVFIKTSRGMTFSPATGDLGPWLALSIVLGPILLGAGHHVTRRRPEWRPGVVLTALGGVLLVAMFFIPPARGSDSLIGLFFDSRFVSRGWPLTIWALGMLVTGLTAACLLLPDFKPAKLSPFLGAMIRILLIGFPGAILVMILTAGGGPGFVSVIASVGWLITRFYALLILTASGLALVLRGPEEVDLSDAVAVF